MLTFVNTAFKLPQMPKTQFGKLIREARIATGLTLRGLAARVGMDFTRLSRIEHGSRPAPGLRDIRALADALQLDMVDLLVAAGTSREVMEHLLWSERLRVAEVDPNVRSYRPSVSPLVARNTFCAEVKVRDGALCTASLGKESLVVFSFSSQKELLIEIPPEAVTVYRQAPKTGSAENLLSARVVKVRRLGQVTNVVLAGNGFELNTLHTGRRIKQMDLKEGEMVFASVQATAIRTTPKKEETR